MSIDFPNSPTVGQLFSIGTKTWSWTGSYWQQSIKSTAAISNVQISSLHVDSLLANNTAGIAGQVLKSDGANTYWDYEIAVSGATDTLQNVVSRGSTSDATITLTGSANLSFGSSSNVSIDLSDRSDAIILPKGNSAQRPSSAVTGMLRFNTEDNAFEIYGDLGWKNLSYTSNAIPASETGQVEYNVPGTYSWTAPAGVTSVCVICVGGGGAGRESVDGGSGGGGGGLAWINYLPTVPGANYTVVVGAAGAISGVAGGNSYFVDSDTCIAYGGQGGISASSGGRGGGFYPNGGIGGDGGTYSVSYGSGGGGAGGYTGRGGRGGSAPYPNGLAGAGGAGGGGGVSTVQYSGGGGGGVGVLGQGTSGTGGGSGGVGGGAGSGGISGSQPSGGLYGGGGGGRDTSGGAAGVSGGIGIVRIIWGPDRAFPSTNTGDL